MFLRNAFLVDIVNEKDMRVLKLNSIGNGRNWKGYDVLIFDTWHWWLLTGRKQPWDYVQDNNITRKNMHRTVAYKKALRTWARWVNLNVDPAKTKVFFQGVSPDHVDSRDWGDPTAKTCRGETWPILSMEYPGGSPSPQDVLKRVLRSVSKKVHLLDITRLSQLRKDGHPSAFGYGGHRGSANPNLLRWLFDSAGYQSLDYFLPSVCKGDNIVKPSDEVFEEEARRWQHSLVAKFVGKVPNFGAIGTPLYMDRITTSRSHLAFAKICVEVPIDVVIPRFITVTLRDGSLTSITINVPWMPSRCSSYNTFNHSEKFCPKKVVVKEKERKPIKVNSLRVAYVVVELGHCVSKLSLSTLEKSKEVVMVSPVPPVKKNKSILLVPVTCYILNVELSMVFDVIVDDSVVSRFVADSYNLVAIGPGFVADSVLVVRCILDEFYALLGLKLNASKSGVFLVGVPATEGA
ncbi:hypothetical protein J1N35_019262 [Gossypium stocksii]|uniref:Trichome birefringence-like C-terminal domain-containing protein n=1 Tax=Gossypium stocksii TaxID=47602 RepID=A0A9D4A7Y7_9ROSI|nr:hypothetical protein J1N35_019262 [Gossypium stocksii]